MAVTVFLRLALIARQYELLMPYWSQLKDDLMCFFFAFEQKKAYLNKNNLPTMIKIELAMSLSHEIEFFEAQIALNSQITD